MILPHNFYFITFRIIYFVILIDLEERLHELLYYHQRRQCPCQEMQAFPDGTDRPKEQIALSQIQARKIYGKLNNADLHTKLLHCLSYTIAFLANPSPPRQSTSLPPTVADSNLPSNLHVGAKHLPPTTPPSSECVKRRLSNK